MTWEQELIEQAGGEFLGIEAEMVWFNDPEAGSTMTLGLPAFECEDLVVILVRQLIDAKRMAFARAMSGGHA